MLNCYRYVVSHFINIKIEIESYVTMIDPLTIGFDIGHVYHSIASFSVVIWISC